MLEKRKKYSRKGRCPSCNVRTGSSHRRDCAAVFEYRKPDPVCLDFYGMLKAIDDMVNTDFCADMEFKSAFNKRFSSEEVEEMVSIITDTYKISHCLTCRGCQTKWLKK